MIIVLNGPLGIGKSTLAEALSESMDRAVMLDGDHLVAANPPPPDELEYLHSTIALLVEHHRRFGYRHFIIDHLWTTGRELDDLRRRLVEVDPDATVHCFRLTLPVDECLRRIQRRAGAQAMSDLALEVRTFSEESAKLEGSGPDLGEPFDVSGPPRELVAAMLQRVGYR